MDFREAIERDARDLTLLASRASEACGDRRLLSATEAQLKFAGNDYREMEERLDRASLVLRAAWLAAAHRPADRTMKSPCMGEIAHMASGERVSFGYERDLDASSLESRRADVGPVSDLVLFRSGQAALSGLLLWATGQWAQNRQLTVRHAGAYFETASLIDCWPSQALQRLLDPDTVADLVIAEPVTCSGRFESATIPGAHKALLIDTTLAGPGFDLGPVFGDEGRPDLAIAVRSGLKLDQAGLELANVGIVQIFDRRGATHARRSGDELRQLRGLTGTGLTLDEMSALSAPWFLDRDYARAYTASIFANNRALAAAIGQTSCRFAPDCHPSLIDGGNDAPFCAIRLRQPSPGGYRRLLDEMSAGIERRGLSATRGGSFGFRGHRFELIEPEPGHGETFLRVALGWRDGFSREGLCELFGELAQVGR